MQFRIKQKFWSLGDEFCITDSQQQPVFRIMGKAFSWGDQLSFQDMQGREHAYIRQRLLSWRPKYEIYRQGQLFAEVTKEFSWFNKQFELDVPGPNDYTINGSFWDHEYTFERGGGIVAQVSKAYFSWSDSYGVDIVEGEDTVAILCAVIVIDQVLDDERGAAVATSGG